MPDPVIDVGFPFKAETLHAGIKVHLQGMLHVCGIALAHLGTAADDLDVFEREINGIGDISEHVLFDENKVLICQDQIVAAEHGGKLETFAIPHFLHAQHHGFFRAQFEFFCHFCLL